MSPGQEIGREGYKSNGEVSTDTEEIGVPSVLFPTGMCHSHSRCQLKVQMQVVRPCRPDWVLLVLLLVLSRTIWTHVKQEHWCHTHTNWYWKVLATSLPDRHSYSHRIATMQISLYMASRSMK